MSREGLNKISGIWTTITNNNTNELKREWEVRKIDFYEKKTIVRPLNEEELEQNYEIIEETKTKIPQNILRSPKSKKEGVEFEDRMWTLMYDLGFEELSYGRNFYMPTKRGWDNSDLSPTTKTNIERYQPRQIDVFAKDSLSCLVIECKQKEQFGTRSNLDMEIEKFANTVANFKQNHIIDEQYDVLPPYFQGYIFATDNINWTEARLQQAKNQGIVVFRETDFRYYRNLIKNVGSAAKNQFMNDVFKGQRLPTGNKKVFAVQGFHETVENKKTHYYQFMIDADSLAKISYVQHRFQTDITSGLKYQRMFSKIKLSALAKHIKEKSSVFPTNIVINFQPNTRNSKVDFQQTDKGNQVDADDLKVGWLTLPNHFQTSLIIDGQHRLFSYFHPSLKDTDKRFSTSLPVLAYEDLDTAEQAQIFMDINSNQSTVAKNLIEELKGDLYISSKIPSKQLEGMASKVLQTMTNDPNSPFHKKIKIESNQDESPPITLSLFRSSLTKNGFIGMTGKGLNTSEQIIKGGFLWVRRENQTDTITATMKRTQEFLNEFFRLFSEGPSKEHWDMGVTKNEPTKNKPGAYLCTNSGIGSMLNLIPTLLKHIAKKDHLEDDWVKFFQDMSVDNIVEKLEKYIKPIQETFTNPTAGLIRNWMERITVAPVIPAEERGMREMQIKIQNTHRDFEPDGLFEFQKRMHELWVAQAQQIYTRFENDLTKLLRTFLECFYPKDILEVDYHGTSDIWLSIKAVPHNLGVELNQRQLQKDQAGQRSDLFSVLEMPGDFIEIMTYKNNNYPEKLQHLNHVNPSNSSRINHQLVFQGIFAGSDFKKIQNDFEQIQKHIRNQLFHGNQLLELSESKLTEENDGQYLTTIANTYGEKFFNDATINIKNLVN